MKRREPKTVCLARVNDAGDIQCVTSPMTRSDAEALQEQTRFSTRIIPRIQAARRRAGRDLRSRLRA